MEAGMKMNGKKMGGKAAPKPGKGGKKKGY